MNPARAGLAAALLAALGALAGAQSAATLSGQIRDPAGKPLAGVTVAAQSLPARATRFEVISDPRGRYQLRLTPGRWRIEARKPGYATVVVQRRLSAGAVQAEIELTPALPTHPTIPSATAESTPLNGRDWTQLATLQPGVSGVETENSAQGHTAQRGFGAALSISGARPEENDYVLDGISISDYSNGAPGSVVGAALGVDAVQRIAALGSNYSANVGRTGGGVISAATRSGGDAWHGSLYEFLRNSALDARNFFDTTRPPFRRNQFGASIGGPIRWGPDKFVFADYEGLRQALGLTTVDTVPSAAARAGQLASGAVAVDPGVARFVAALYPLPNGPLLGAGDTGIYRFSGQQITGENYFTTRFDWRRPRANDSVSYLHDGSGVTQPDAYNNLVSSVLSRRQMVAVQDQRAVGTTALNTARFGFSRAVAVDGGLSRVLNPAILAAGFSMVPGEFVGAIAVPGLTSFGGGPAANLQFSNSSKSFAWNSFQAYDDYAFSHGAHALQFGGVLERMQSNVGINSDANGNFAFGSLRDFLLNQPLTFDSDRAGPLAIFGIRETLLATYLQDAVQVRPGLSLSAGLRYEYTTVPGEAHNRLANLQHLTDASARLGEPYFLNPTVNDFSPRLGLSWQARANDLVESGFGIFDVLPLPYEFNIIVPEAYPYLQQFVDTTLPVGAFPTAAYALAASNPTLFRTTYIEHDPHRSYVMQWNLKLEHRLNSHGALSLAYVGSRSVHLPLRSDDFNTVMPALTSAGYVYPPAASSQRLNPNFGRISGITWNADGYYNALQASLTASRPWLHLQVSYTWGQSLDTGTATVTADQYDNSLVNMPWFNTRLNRGPSDLNLAQNLVVSGNWSVPAGAGAASRLLGGWQLNQVFRASTGSPFTAELGGDPLGRSSRR